LDTVRCPTCRSESTRRLPITIDPSVMYRRCDACGYIWAFFKGDGIARSQALASPDAKAPD